jgi:hypothetical protein
MRLFFRSVADYISDRYPTEDKKYLLKLGVQEPSLEWLYKSWKS